MTGEYVCAVARYERLIVLELANHVKKLSHGVRSLHHARPLPGAPGVADGEDRPGNDWLN